MTIRYFYTCDSCGYNYIEQRGSDQPDVLVAKCAVCNEGNNIETSKEVLAPEPERVPAPEVILEETPAE